MSTRALAVVALLGLFLTTSAAPADAARGSSKQARTDKAAKKKGDKKTRKGGDTSLRGRFAKIPTPRVPGASKIRLEFKPSGAGDGKRGRVFTKSKLKAKGPTDASFAQKVRKSTRRALRKQ